jgi:imidazolonepropionase-like amidohydrolase
MGVLATGALACMLTLLPAAQAQQKVSTDFVVTNVRVFDGREVLPNTHVVVSGGTILAVGGDMTAWRKLTTIDGAGSTLIPGLIDAHAHVSGVDDLRQALRFGVTTVLDMAAISTTPAELSAIRAKAAVAPDIADVRTAGYPATSFRGHPTQYVRGLPRFTPMITGQDFVASRRTEGSDYLKIVLNGVRVDTPLFGSLGPQNIRFTNLDEPQTRSLVEAAHAAGMLAVAHVESLDDANIALAAGVDGLAHVWRRGGANPDTARRLAERKAFVVPTLAVSDGFFAESRASLLADPRFQSVLSDQIRQHLGRPFASPTAASDGRVNFEAMMAAVRGLHHAGVELLVGADPSQMNPAAHGISVHREVELLVQAGLKPSEVLAAATANPAKAFRLHDRGRILPGRRADMILVRGDPTTDVLATRDIVRIWKLGVEVDRAVP